jgi:hypothetical protein
MAQHTTPCATCPFRRTTEPGYLGGSPTQTYVGQTEAGFMIACHSCINYDDPDWKEKASVYGNVGQCAGAAIFRSNIEKPRPALLTLPPNTDIVFASYAEFVAHHEGITLAEAEQCLRDVTPAECAQAELRRAGVVLNLIVKRATN